MAQETETTFDYNAAVNNAIAYVLERLPENVKAQWVAIYEETGSLWRPDYTTPLSVEDAALFERLCEESGKASGGHSGASFSFTQIGAIAKVIGL